MENKCQGCNLIIIKYCSIFEHKRIPSFCPCIECLLKPTCSLVCRKRFLFWITGQILEETITNGDNSKIVHLEVITNGSM